MCNMFIGGLLASTGYALAPVSNSKRRRSTLPPVPAADDLTQRQLSKYPYFFRTTWTSSQPTSPDRAMGLRAGLQKDRRPSPPTTPSATKQVGGFQKAFEDCGGKIIQKIWPPLGE